LSYLSKVANFNLLSPVFGASVGVTPLSFAAIIGIGKLKSVQGYLWHCSGPDYDQIGPEPDAAPRKGPIFFSAFKTEQVP